jgi:hypothetical protein
MTKNNIIIYSLILNILKQFITTKVTKESQKLSLYSTKIYSKHTKDFLFLILVINAFSITNFCVHYCKI